MHSASGPRPALPSILVVEDDDAIARSIADIVEDAGYVAVTASTLTQARAALATEEPGLVILDLTLHSEFGADLLDELAGAPNAPPVIIVSAFALAKMIGERHRVPVVMKPFGIDELTAAIEGAFDARRRVGT